MTAGADTLSDAPARGEEEGSATATPAAGQAAAAAGAPAAAPAHVTATAPQRLEVGPAPVVELAYAYYCLLSVDRRNAPLPWLRELRDHPPKWLAAATDSASGYLGYEALLLACALGYEADRTPERFLTDLPKLPARLLAEFDEAFDPAQVADDAPEGPSRLGALRASLGRLGEPEAAGQLVVGLSRLWDHLSGAWEDGGVQATEAASRDLIVATLATGDLMASLPPHHFVQLENSAQSIRAHQRQGRTLVVPLYFATRGGFKFLVRERLFIGYGVRSEDIYEEQKGQVDRLAGRLKAFSDPTRLLLLFHVSRLSRFPLTVGDLATQLGVTQPTASGHLRLLRELELVHVLRRGNRSYYQLDRDAVRATLEELERLLVPPA